ncbi:glycosyltransferase [Actinomycetospora sp. TBRC 11914]|nr:glycosyltransferase [Actinomycetospora sp. TBRC 11914]
MPLVVAGSSGGSVPLALGGRVLVVSATVGQGHEGAARELAGRLRARGVDVTVRDHLDALPGVARRILRDLYQPTVQYAPALFDTLFHGLEHDGPLRRTVDAVCRWAEPEVERWAAEADVVVTTYPLAGQTLGALREQGRITVPTMTYLTDPAAHATWCHPAVDHHLTVTRATALDARRYGVRSRAVGPLCSPAFTHPGETRGAVRAGLGLPAEAPVALISAGSLGMGAVPQTVRDLLTHPRLRVVVLCGRNAGLRRRLGRDPRVVALGWRDDVAALMGAADVLVHNAGGLSLTEALAAGLPAITYRPIAGHGRANAAVLDRAGIAPWPHGAAELVHAVDTVIGEPGRRRRRWWPAGADPAAAVQDVLAGQRPAPAPTGAAS